MITNWFFFLTRVNPKDEDFDLSNSMIKKCLALPPFFYVTFILWNRHVYDHGVVSNTAVCSLQLHTSHSSKAKCNVQFSFQDMQTEILKNDI